MTKLIKEYCWREISSDGLVKIHEVLGCHSSQEEAEEELARYYDQSGYGEFVLLTIYRKDYFND